MIERAIKIIKDGKIKQREFSIANKYSSNYEADDYGYISFTEDANYHEVTIDIPVEVRFVLDKSKLEKNYKLIEFSFDKTKEEYLKSEYDEDLDIVLANEDWFGDESELRIYDDIPLKNYLVAVEIVEGGTTEEEKQLKVLCKQNNIEFRNEI
jgi:hypothetical protein